MKQRMRSLGKKLELITYAHDKLFSFKLTSSEPDATVSIPIPIMYRYYHIGRAYDLHQLKNLQPTSSVSMDFLSIQLLVQELEQISEIISDPVLNHYSNLLVPYLKTTRENTKERLILSAPAN